MLLNICFKEFNDLPSPVERVIMADGYLEYRSIATKI